jgi:anaerobic selenocysteine-containing dehydrogenase
VTTTTLLGELKKRGVKVRRSGERLLLSDLHGALTPELRAAIDAHREELLATLDRAERSTVSSVDSVCPYCGVGCAIRYFVDEAENRIQYADGRESPVNHERLCVKGRFGFDYTSHPERLRTPLIRKESSYPKGPLSTEVRGEGKRRPGGLVDYEEVLPHFREATWEEADP